MWKRCGFLRRSECMDSDVDLPICVEFSFRSLIFSSFDERKRWKEQILRVFHFPWKIWCFDQILLRIYWFLLYFRSDHRFFFLWWKEVVEGAKLAASLFVDERSNCFDRILLRIYGCVMHFWSDYRFFFICWRKSWKKQILRIVYLLKKDLKFFLSHFNVDLVICVAYWFTSLVFLHLLKESWRRKRSCGLFICWGRSECFDRIPMRIYWYLLYFCSDRRLCFFW